MVSASLLTICIGLACSISESQVDYYEKAASSSVHILAKELQASRARLQGFSEWLRLKTVVNTKDFLNGVDNYINPTLKAIKGNVTIALAEGKVAEQCYTVALHNIKQKAEEQLPAVVSCITTVTNSTNETLVDVADRLRDMKRVEEQLVSILPNCIGNDHKTDCIKAGLETVTSSILSLQNYTRSTVEHGNAKYLKQFSKAFACILQVFKQLLTQMNSVLDESNMCIQNAETVS